MRSAATVGGIGEFGLIERIARAARRAGSAPQLRVPIGDDAAVLRPPRGRDLAISADALVEGVHFRWRTQDARRIGRRALVANLSDLAAMGAQPLGFTLSLACPPTLPLERFDAVMAGLLFEARRAGCPLVGGNLSRARETSLHITAFGHLPPGRALLRRGAAAGDRLLVTGALGASALELARAERGLGPIRRVPTARLRAGARLLALPAVGFCIDVSDGLEADLAHVLRGSGLVARLARERLPLARGLRAGCRALGLDPHELALHGGEDYELLFGLRAQGPSAAWLSRRLGVAVHEIGRLVEAAGGYRSSAAPRPPRGYRHF